MILSDQTAPDIWTWQAVYMKSQLIWEYMRVQLNVMPYAGPVSFDNVMLIEISEPDPTF